MSSILHRKESLVLTAVEIINELGIQGLSTREIAKRQGISDGAIFKHFKNKNELLLELLEHYSQYDSDIIQSIVIKKLKPKDAIRYFIKSYAEYYDNYPEITSITLAYDVLACDENLRGKIKDIFFERLNFINMLVEEAISSGELDPRVDIDGMTNIIEGAFRNIVLKWRFDGYSYSLKEKTIKTIDSILKAFENLD